MSELGNKPPEDSRQRDEKGRLLPGNTANPSGRSAIAKQMREYMAGFTKECIDGILAIARDEKNEPKDRTAAYRWVAEQVVGKPAQSLTDAEGNPLSLGLIFLPPTKTDDAG